MLAIAGNALSRGISIDAETLSELPDLTICETKNTRNILIGAKNIAHS